MFVLGGLAVHRELFGGKPSATGDWVVSHVVTGSALPRLKAKTLREAKALAEKALPLAD